MRFAIFLLAFFVPFALRSQTDPDAASREARAKSVAIVTRDYPDATSTATPLGKTYETVVKEWTADPAHRSLMLEADVPELILKEAAQRTALQVVREGKFPTYDAALASFKVSTLPAATPATVSPSDPGAFAKAVKESSARAEAREPDLLRPGSSLYQRFAQIKQQWTSRAALSFNDPAWPEKLLDVALHDLIDSPPFTATNIKNGWIADLRAKHLPDSEYGHGKRNADLDAQEASIGSGVWNDDAEGQADRLNAKILRGYGLASAANQLDTAAATIEARCKERDERARQQGDATAQQGQNAGAQWSQNWQTQQRINQLEAESQYQQSRQGR